jgi:hypothetical protein
MWERETAGLALVAERQGQVVGIIAVTAIPYLECPLVAGYHTEMVNR